MTETRDTWPLTFDLDFYLGHFGAGRGTAEFVNMTAVNTLTGPIDVDAFVASCKAVIRRQETIRAIAVPPNDGQAGQIRVLPEDAVDVEVVDYSDLSEVEAHARANRLASERGWATFQFYEGVLFRFFLIILPRDTYVAGVACHHYLADAISLAIIWRDIADNYRRLRAYEPLLPPPKRTYKDFILERREWDEGWRATKNAAHWERVLEQLGPDSGHKTAPNPNAPAVRPSLDFSAERTALTQFARKERVTFFTLMLALFAGTLIKHTPGEKMAIAVLTDQRIREEYLDLCGFFAGVVPVFLQANDDPSFRTLLQRARSATLEIMENPWAPADVAAHIYKNRISLHILDYVDLQKFAVRFADDITVARFELEPPPTQGMTANAFVFAQTPDGMTGAAVGQFTEHWAHYADVLSNMKKLIDGALKDPDAKISTLLNA
jgi:hypothetical protein